MGYYLSKCQILVDYFNNNPMSIEATQEMIDELVEEGFLGKNGLTKMGKKTAKVIDLVFHMADAFHSQMKKDLTKAENKDRIYNNDC